MHSAGTFGENLHLSDGQKLYGTNDNNALTFSNDETMNLKSSFNHDITNNKDSKISGDNLKKSHHNEYN